MNAFNTLLAHFTAYVRGATATEYGLLFAGIALAILSVVNQVGHQLVAILDRVVTGLIG